MPWPLRCAAVLGWGALAALTTPGCARTHDRARDASAKPERTEPDLEPTAAGDLSAFAEIDALVVVYDGDYEREPDAPRAPLPVERALMVYTTVNGGGFADRVPDLRVFVAGSEVKESSSAANPPQFSYQSGSLAQTAPVSLEFQLAGAAFSVELESADVEIQQPEPEAVLSPEAGVIVQWTGRDRRPQEASISAVPGLGPCTARFTSSSLSAQEGVFEYTWPAPQAAQPSCHAQLNLSWRAEPKLVEGTPFRALRIAHNVRRLRRFELVPVR